MRCARINKHTRRRRWTERNPVEFVGGCCCCLFYDNLTPKIDWQQVKNDTEKIHTDTLHTHDNKLNYMKTRQMRPAKNAILRAEQLKSVCLSPRHFSFSFIFRSAADKPLYCRSRRALESGGGGRPVRKNCAAVTALFFICLCATHENIWHWP